jgi:hypothetical protein
MDSCTSRKAYISISEASPNLYAEEIVEGEKHMKYILFVSALAISFAVSGCMAGYTTMHHERREMAERDSLTPPPMTINDIIALSQDSVSADVIISQMKATDSYFRLTTEDIVALRKAGVNDKVINAMIQTGKESKAKRARTRAYPAYYPYWGWGYSWYPYYWNQWYNPYYFGLSYRTGFFGGYHHGGFHYGGAHFGGVRTTRTRR